MFDVSSFINYDLCLLACIANPASASKGNTVYVIGGEAGGGPLAVNEGYKVSSDTWSANAPMLTPRGEMGVVGTGGRIYTVGGALPAFGSSSSANEVFKP